MLTLTDENVMCYALDLLIKDNLYILKAKKS